MKKFLVLSLLVSVLFYSPVSFAQKEIDPAEITSTVPELSDFHKIIYPMWHDAYPAKDYNALKGFVPQIKTSVESINRVIPPVIKEIDDFHQTLYIIYHKLYPDGKFDEITGLTSDLVAKAEAIMNYPKDRLKQRLGDNINKFDGAAKHLVDATIVLKDALKGDDPKKKSEAIESLHTAYQDLDAVFH